MRFEQCLRRRVALVAGAILAGAVPGVSSAAATPVGEVMGVVDETVKSVQAAPNAAPSLPSPPPPPATPPTRSIPAAPRLPDKLPTQATPAPAPRHSPSPSSPPNNPGAVDVPSAVDRTVGAARNTVEAVTSTGAETTKPATSARKDGTGAPAFQGGADAGPSNASPRAIRTGPNAPLSIAAAKVVALQRWVARIWPAISLGGSGAGRGSTARAMMMDLFRPAAAVIARVLSLSTSITPAAGGWPFAGHPGTGRDPQNGLPSSLAADGSKIVYLVTLTALLSLLAFTVWREFRSALRPRVR
jgi:hypothetical protein